MKKCPVCSREYRDVVSLCPFDGAGLAPLAAAAPEAFTVAPLDEEPPVTLQLPAEDAREIIVEAEEIPTEIVAPPRVAQPTTLLTDPLPLRSRDEEETHYRPITIPLEEDEPAPPPPPVNDYRPNAANAASLPYANEYEENRRAYNPGPPPVVPPIGAGRPPMPPPKEANPWRWATFGLAGLMLVFAGAWFFLGGSRPGANANDPMAVDPNAANVNTAPPITGMEGFPPPDANFNAGNFNSLPLPPAGTGVNPNLGGSTGPFPSGPPPSLSNINSVYPPPVINSNAPNANAPNFNSGGIKSVPTPNPLASPKPAATPKPLATPAAGATPGGTVKPVATPGPAASPKPTAAKSAASPKPAGTPEGPEPLR
jgi:hypothetical protein